MLKEFIERLSKLEDVDHPYKPSYLKMKPDEDDELAEMCKRRRCEKCESPEEYCWHVIRAVEEKSALYSAANRILDALEKHGSHVLLGLTDGERELDAGEFLDSEYGEKICLKCRMNGTTECPEDFYGPTCLRRDMVSVVGKVLSAVNELV